MKKRTPESAIVLQSLLWLDEPEILLLKKNTKEFVIAVASPDPIGDFGGGYHFVGASITERVLRDYQEEKFDLRFAMSHAMFGRFWAFSFDGESEHVELTRCKIDSELVRCSLPETGLFARVHDRIENIDEFVADVDAKFEIDGSWDLGEFSSFYGKMEDVYYIANDIRRFQNGSTSQSTKKIISETFQKPWRGGGSYRSYYKDIANDNAAFARLKVGGIQYNSPGFVRIEAKKQAFDDFVRMLEQYAANPKGIKKSYEKLHKYMSMHSLLKSSADTVLRPVISDQITLYANEIAETMNLMDFGNLCRMTEGNVLVAAKVQLSIVRRVENLYEFFEQGRVSYSDLRADPLNAET